MKTSTYPARKCFWVSSFVWASLFTTMLHAADNVVAEVNGQKITEADLQLEYLIRQVPESSPAQVREQVINGLIEQKLIQAFLQRQQVKVNKIRLEAATESLYKMIRKANRKPQELLSEIGISEEMLKQQLRLPLLWQIYIEKVATPERMRAYFKKHRQEFDGTELRLSQIFLKPNPKEDPQNKLQQLMAIKQKIESGQYTFAEAARQHSEAPTAAKGGEMGFTPYEGKTPTQITRHVFGLTAGEISEPFLSSFGAHLIKVTEIKPGDLSLEDVRPQVRNRVSHELWNRQVEKMKSGASIKVY